MNGQEHSPSHLSTFIITACTVNVKKLAPSVKNCTHYLPVQGFEFMSTVGLTTDVASLYNVAFSGTLCSKSCS